MYLMTERDSFRNIVSNQDRYVSVQRSFRLRFHRDVGTDLLSASDEHKVAGCYRGSDLAEPRDGRYAASSRMLPLASCHESEPPSLERNLSISLVTCMLILKYTSSHNLLKCYPKVLE